MDTEALKTMSERDLVMMLVQMKAVNEPEENIKKVVAEIARRKPTEKRKGAVMKMGEIESDWQDLWKNINSDNKLSEAQEREMRKAFYAGFFGCFHKVVNYSLKLREEEAAKKLDILSAELKEFKKELEKR